MFKCSNMQIFKCQISKLNKVKLLSEPTSGVPLVVFTLTEGSHQKENQIFAGRLTIILTSPLQLGFVIFCGQKGKNSSMENNI